MFQVKRKKAQSCWALEILKALPEPSISHIVRAGTSLKFSGLSFIGLGFWARDRLEPKILRLLSLDDSMFNT